MNKKTICALVAAALLGAAGATISASRAIESYRSTPQKTNTVEVLTIKGKPISVDTEIYYHTKGSISTVIETEGKKVLCSYKTDGWKNIDCLILSEANALIQSEINDGDDESIELTGKYNGNKFEINSLKANGYEINFE